MPIECQTEEGDWIACPLFFGGVLQPWIMQIEEFFAQFPIPTEQHVNLASHHLVGAASTWGLRHEDNIASWNWSQFISALRDEFDPTYVEDSIDLFVEPGDSIGSAIQEINGCEVGSSVTQVNMENDFLFQRLHTLKQFSTVEFFQRQFELLQSLVSTRYTDLDEAFYVTCCINGLKEDIKKAVQFYQPLTVRYALRLATLQESILAEEAEDITDKLIVTPIQSVAGSQFDIGEEDTVLSDNSEIESVVGMSPPTKYSVGVCTDLAGVLQCSAGVNPGNEVAGLSKQALEDDISEFSWEPGPDRLFTAAGVKTPICSVNNSSVATLSKNISARGSSLLLLSVDRENMKAAETIYADTAGSIATQNSIQGTLHVNHYHTKNNVVGVMSRIFSRVSLRITANIIASEHERYSFFCWEPGPLTLSYDPDSETDSTKQICNQAITYTIDPGDNQIYVLNLSSGVSVTKFSHSTGVSAYYMGIFSWLIAWMIRFGNGGFTIVSKYQDIIQTIVSYFLCCLALDSKTYVFLLNTNFPATSCAPTLIELQSYNSGAIRSHIVAESVAVKSYVPAHILHGRKPPLVVLKEQHPNVLSNKVTVCSCHLSASHNMASYGRFHILVMVHIVMVIGPPYGFPIMIKYLFGEMRQQQKYGWQTSRIGSLVFGCILGQVAHEIDQSVAQFLCVNYDATLQVLILTASLSLHIPLSPRAVTIGVRSRSTSITSLTSLSQLDSIQRPYNGDMGFFFSLSSIPASLQFLACQVCCLVHHNFILMRVSKVKFARTVDETKGYVTICAYSKNPTVCMFGWGRLVTLLTVRITVCVEHNFKCRFVVIVDSRFMILAISVMSFLPLSAYGFLHNASLLAVKDYVEHFLYVILLAGSNHIRVLRLRLWSLLLYDFSEVTQHTIGMKRCLARMMIIVLIRATMIHGLECADVIFIDRYVRVTEVSGFKCWSCSGIYSSYQGQKQATTDNFSYHCPFLGAVRSHCVFQRMILLGSSATIQLNQCATGSFFTILLLMIIIWSFASRCVRDGTLFHFLWRVAWLSIHKFDGSMGSFYGPGNMIDVFWCVAWTGVMALNMLFQIGLLVYCQIVKKEVYNTAKVNAQTSDIVKRSNQAEDEPSSLSWVWRPEYVKDRILLGIGSVEMDYLVE